MDSPILQWIHSLDEDQQQQFYMSPVIREIYVDTISTQLNIKKERVVEEIESIINRHEKNVEEIVRTRKKIRYIRDRGESYKLREKRALLRMSIMNVISNSQGVSKTQILRNIKKDNGSWRGRAQDALDELEAQNLIIKVGSKYYNQGDLMARENTYHRKVYDIIVENGPVSKSKILTLLKYRNPNGLKKLIPVLEMMKEEELIEDVRGVKWIVKE